jgi:hypothetical protein
LEATAVDIDLTVIQVNNCEHLRHEIGLSKLILNDQRQL